MKYLIILALLIIGFSLGALYEIWSTKSFCTKELKKLDTIVKDIKQILKEAIQLENEALNKIQKVEGTNEIKVYQDGAWRRFMRVEEE